MANSTDPLNKLQVPIMLSGNGIIGDRKPKNDPAKENIKALTQEA